MRKATTIVHVNINTIRSNAKHKRTLPPITTKQGRSNRSAHRVVINDAEGRPAAVVVYSPDKPLSCGAKVWIEALYGVESQLNPAYDSPEGACQIT